MMRPPVSDDGIGRLLVASLHHAIGDAMPTRLDYYEHWLSPMGLRDGRSGLAPLGAVLSFLRQEGQPVYDDVMTRAGRASAEWRLAEDRTTVRVARMLPRRLRARYALRRSRALVRDAFAPALARVTSSKRRAAVQVDDSVFCVLREPWPWATCTYFAAAIERHLELCGVPARVEVARCRSGGTGSCRLEVDFTASPRGVGGEA